MVSLWDWLPWLVPSTPCQPVRVWDGEPVGCAACGQFPRYPASGEGVAVVSVGRMVSLWDGVPQFQR